ncbi:MAG: hemerythrin domain-containing protein [Nitrospirae bacterium]|nr:hemerythrin domain-containing protein [Nitrospirota bacterium]
MPITRDYRKQHEKILELIDELSEYLSEERLKSGAHEARSILSRLSGALKVHLAMEDNSLYPRLLASKDEQIRSTAKQFIEEIGDIASAFNDYLHRWPKAASIENNPVEFINESKEFFRKLGSRIQREDDILYPLLERAQAT